jgi:hypothetical protein
VSATRGFTEWCPLPLVSLNPNVRPDLVAPFERVTAMLASEIEEGGSSPSAMLTRMVDDQPPTGRSRKKANADTALEDGDGYDFVKGPWTPREDELLTLMVQTYGTKRWSLVASNFKGRTGKQCRERWTNQLNPLINKRPWSTEEDEVRTLMRGAPWNVSAICALANADPDRRSPAAREPLG